MTGFNSKRQMAKAKLDDEPDTQVYAGRKRGSIALARSLCYQINGAADDSDDMDGGGYGSVDIAEILSAEVLRLQKALAQPEQEPVAWVCYGAPGKRDIDFEEADINGLPIGTSLYITPPQQQAEMRMPRVGDRVICLEDESLGEVVSLTAGGSPDIVFDDGSRGTYRLSEFAELFGYVAAQGDKASFNNWWNGDYDDSANKFEKDSAAYWAWAGWQAAKRPWVGLTEDEISLIVAECSLMSPSDHYFAQAIEAKLKERNT